MSANALSIPLLAALTLCAAPRPVQDSEEVQADPAQLERAFREQGVRLDRAGGWCAIPVEVEVRDALLEYLLVGPGGRAHESLFMTEVAPSVLNAALILLGAEPGKNASWRPKDPRPSEAELQNGVSPYAVEVPQGSGFFLYVGWREGGETYFFRVEDLLRDLSRGRSMQRHRWIYLGSRMISTSEREAQGERVFAADLYRDVINIAFFNEGLTVLTAALPECVEQTIWIPNAWLLPERGERLWLFFAKERIECLAPEVARELPEVRGGSTGGK